MTRFTTRMLSLEVIDNGEIAARAERAAADPAISPPAEQDPAAWHQAVGIARQACARIFRDGGTAADAVLAFGIAGSHSAGIDWGRAVRLIADSLSVRPDARRRAA